MKGFKPTGKMVRSGHHFSDRDGFSGSSGKTQTVKGYTRRVVKKADGGQVKSPGNAAQLRTEPVTDFDQQYGGRGPLAPGYRGGGYISAKGNGRSFNKKPLIGK